MDRITNFLKEIHQIDSFWPRGSPCPYPTWPYICIRNCYKIMMMYMISCKYIYIYTYVCFMVFSFIIFIFFIYHSSSFFLEILIFCGAQFRDLYTYAFMQWKTCMPVGQHTKSLWFNKIGVYRCWLIYVQETLLKRCLSWM